MSFAANGITAEGIKAFDRVLQSNIVLKTLNLSGNPIGDEGAKVRLCPLLFISLVARYLEYKNVGGSFILLLQSSGLHS